MDFKDFIAAEDDDDRRLDRIIRNIFSSSKSVKTDQLLRKGLIKLNDRKAEASVHVHKGDRISIALFLLENQPTEDKSTKPEVNSEFNLKDIFINQHIRIIDKPYGITSQGSAGEKISLSCLVQQDYEKTHENSSLSFKTGPLHRLDKNTTGLLAFSQSTLGARWFTENIKTHAIKKTYVAVVQGKFRGTSKWTDFIADTPQESLKSFHKVKVISQEDLQQQPGFAEKAAFKEAVTTATFLASGFFNAMDVTLVQFDIETGRKHQIRSQSSFHGFPLFNDTAYNAKPIPGNNRIYLHAARLSFPPDNPLELPEELYCPLPGDFRNFLDSVLIKWDGKLIIS